MNKITLDPSSLLAGAALALVAALAMGAQATAPPPTTTRSVMDYRRIPAANLVYIIGGNPFTVPVGRTLVITGIGNADVGSTLPIGDTFMILDGVQRRFPTRQYPTPVLSSLGTGIPIAAGSVVDFRPGSTLSSNASLAFATGYLEKL